MCVDFFSFLSQCFKCDSEPVTVVASPEFSLMRDDDIEDDHEETDDKECTEEIDKEMREVSSGDSLEDYLEIVIHGSDGEIYTRRPWDRDRVER